MYRRIDDFLADWKDDSAGTLKVLQALTDESLSTRVDPGGRTAGRLAWHIAGSVRELPTTAGLTGVEGPGDDEEPPATAAEIVEAYRRASESMQRAVESQWTDEMLTGEIPMYGMTWTRGQTLGILMRHEAHHRGQLTVLMRSAGLTVPGCYGPAREEWAAMGMEAMA